MPLAALPYFAKSEGETSMHSGIQSKWQLHRATSWAIESIVERPSDREDASLLLQRVTAGAFRPRGLST